MSEKRVTKRKGAHFDDDLTEHLNSSTDWWAPGPPMSPKFVGLRDDKKAKDIGRE
jgi:hypothetical protein